MGQNGEIRGGRTKSGLLPQQSRGRRKQFRYFQRRPRSRYETERKITAAARLAKLYEKRSMPTTEKTAQ